MATYCEKNTKTVIDWSNFLETAVNDPDSISTDEHNRYLLYSESWITCACGNQCNVIPRNWTGMPEDEMLTHLGIQFHACIEARDYKEATFILRDIESRSAELIAEINAKE